MSGLLHRACFKMYRHAVKLLNCHLGVSVYPAIFLALKKKKSCRWDICCFLLPHLPNLDLASQSRPVRFAGYKITLKNSTALLIVMGRKGVLESCGIW